jgi:hypothetical protein
MLLKFKFFLISTINLLKNPFPCINNFDFTLQHKSISGFPELKYSACTSLITLCKYSFDLLIHSS